MHEWVSCWLKDNCVFALVTRCFSSSETGDLSTKSGLKKPGCPSTGVPKLTTKPKPTPQDWCIKKIILSFWGNGIFSAAKCHFLGAQTNFDIKTKKRMQKKNKTTPQTQSSEFLNTTTKPKPPPFNENKKNSHKDSTPTQNPPLKQQKNHTKNVSQGTLPGIAFGGPPFPSATSLGSRTSMTKGSLRPWGVVGEISNRIPSKIQPTHPPFFGQKK